VPRRTHLPHSQSVTAGVVPFLRAQWGPWGSVRWPPSLSLGGENRVTSCPHLRTTPASGVARPRRRLQHVPLANGTAPAPPLASPTAPLPPFNTSSSTRLRLKSLSTPKIATPSTMPLNAPIAGEAGVRPCPSGASGLASSSNSVEFGLLHRVVEL
jgi:hypothetical protein